MEIFWQSKMDQAKAADHPEQQIVEATFRNLVGHCFTLLYSD
jgi:hypothetical protein